MERQTRQRQAVLDSLASSGRTLSPPEILELARQQAPGLNLSTVYRQVKALESDGELVRVELPGQPARFEAPCRRGSAGHASRNGRNDAGHDELPHHHHHFHCLSCNAVVPIHGCPGGMQDLAPRGYRVESHDLVLHGRCPRCAGEVST